MEQWRKESGRREENAVLVYIHKNYGVDILLFRIYWKSFFLGPDKLKNML